MSEVFSVLLHNRQRYKQGKRGPLVFFADHNRKAASSPAGNRDQCR